MDNYEPVSRLPLGLYPPLKDPPAHIAWTRVTLQKEDSFTVAALLISKR